MAKTTLSSPDSANTAKGVEKYFIIRAIKALFGIYKRTSNKGDDHCPPHPPFPPVCPCTEQEYVLSEDYKVKIDKGKEVKHDFILDPSSFKECGTLSGQVKDDHGHAIINALVKVFDENSKPVAHVFTNDQGQYLLCLPTGKYIIKAVR